MNPVNAKIKNDPGKAESPETKFKTILLTNHGALRQTSKLITSSRERG